MKFRLKYTEIGSLQVFVKKKQQKKFEIQYCNEFQQLKMSSKNDDVD